MGKEEDGRTWEPSRWSNGARVPGEYIDLSPRCKDFRFHGCGDGELAWLNCGYLGYMTRRSCLAALFGYVNLALYEQQTAYGQRSDPVTGAHFW